MNLDLAWPVRVYWEDTDAGGVVYYANYLRFFERARTEWLRARGVQQSAWKARTGGMFVVGEASVRYLQSARLDDELRVTTELLRLGRASMSLAQQVWRPGPGPSRDSAELLCEATLRAGWVGAGGRPTRIPSELLELMR